MKLNKKECRKFAISEKKMCTDSGLFRAEQIEYIIRTAVKIIDRHKILILYIYLRKKAAQGNLKPCMTMFHSLDNFITLEYKDDGSTVWRTAAFERLDIDGLFHKKCAFYSQKDEVRIGKYFKSDTDGFALLIRTQDAILEHRRMERQRTKEKRILDRMVGVPAMPRGLKGWIHKSVMPGYFFYNYKKGGRDVPGVCSACGSEIRLSGVKQGVQKICPHCRKEIICKPRSRRSKHMYDRNTCQVIQRISDNELVIRIIKIYYSYNDSDTPEINIYENARHFVHRDARSGQVQSESYYYTYHSGILTDWKEGERPCYSIFYSGFESEASGHLYTKNLPDALAGTPWQYCPIADFYKHFRKPFLAPRFLIVYLYHPALEHLIKTGFYSIVESLFCGYTDNCLNESQHRTHRILGIAAEDVDYLRGHDPDMTLLKIYQGYTGLKKRRELLTWQIRNDASNDVLPILQHMTPHKAMRYLDTQFGFLRFRKTKYGGQRYKTMQDLVTEYRDYLDICKKLEYDLKNSFVKYPKDLQKAHDKAAKRLKHKIDAKMKRDFAAVYKNISGQYDFEISGMKIVYPKISDDIIREGHALHHCVGSYTGRIIRGECVVLFLRQCCDLEKSFYTIEIRGNKLVQVRGLGNCVATPDVEKFIKSWKQRVLDRINIAA